MATKHPQSEANANFSESRTARLERLRAEVQAGTYKVDCDRLALCILARSAESVASRLAGRELDVRVAC